MHQTGDRRGPAGPAHTTGHVRASDHRDCTTDPPELVRQVGSTKSRYLARCIDDTSSMLHDHGDWMDLGSVGGWYGLRKGCRGRFAIYIPPLLEHNPRNNRIRFR